MWFFSKPHMSGVWQPDRERFRRWLRDDGTRRAHRARPRWWSSSPGWRYVVEESLATVQTVADVAPLDPDESIVCFGCGLRFTWEIAHDAVRFGDIARSAGHN